MTCECHYDKCSYHCSNFQIGVNDDGSPMMDEGPFCDEPVCHATPEQVITWNNDLYWARQKRAIPDTNN